MTLRDTAIPLLLLITACGRENEAARHTVAAPQVRDGGATIVLADSLQQAAFAVEAARVDTLGDALEMPGSVACLVGLDAGRTVLFEDAALATAYAQWLQQRAAIEQLRNVQVPQRRLALQRATDLLAHGAATAADVSEARTALAQDEAALSAALAAAQEQGALLLGAGIDPEDVQRSPGGTAYVLCALPEDRLTPGIEGTTCSVRFRALGGTVLEGRVAAIGGRVDPTTRMVRLRLVLNDREGRLRAGLLATATLRLTTGPVLTVPASALVTVQGRDHVFIRTAPGTYQRRTVRTGARVGDRILITDGLAEGEAVVSAGTMLLKGLSFGY